MAEPRQPNSQFWLSDCRYNVDLEVLELQFSVNILPPTAFETFINEPTNNDLAIPTPPGTINAPVEIDDESVVPVNVKTLILLILCPDILISPNIVKLVKLPTDVILVCAAVVKVPLKFVAVNVDIPLNVPEIIELLPKYAPPEHNKAPVEDDIDAEKLLLILICELIPDRVNKEVEAVIFIEELNIELLPT